MILNCTFATAKTRLPFNECLKINDAKNDNDYDADNDDYYDADNDVDYNDDDDHNDDNGDDYNDIEDYGGILSLPLLILYLNSVQFLIIPSTLLSTNCIYPVHWALAFLSL